MRSKPTQARGLRNAIVVGASRGLGRAVALRLAASGYRVTALARDETALSDLEKSAQNVRGAVGDATDPTLCKTLISSLKPEALVLAAGATPRMQALSLYEWEDFETPFQTDSKLTFLWLREALRTQLSEELRIVVFSSGAALHGSFLSGGYAPAKQAQRFLCNYARQEAAEMGKNYRIQTLLPQLNPNTELGRRGVEAYAERAGETAENFVKKRFGTPLTPELAGEAVANMLAGDYDEHQELLLTGKGLSPMAS